MTGPAGSKKNPEDTSREPSAPDRRTWTLDPGPRTDTHNPETTPRVQDLESTPETPTLDLEARPQK